MEKNQIDMDEQVSNSNIREAQFGGRGGQPAWMPGSSPMGRGHKGGSSGINQFGTDLSFESILRNTHRPLPTDDRNLESRLMGLHQNAEEDYISCLPVPIQSRIRLKQKIHQKYEEMEAVANQLITDDKPWYRKEHLQPMEVSLQSRWTNSDELAHDIDTPKPTIQPTRRHSLAKKWDIDNEEPIESIFELNRSNTDSDSSGLFSMNSDDTQNISTPTSTAFDNLQRKPSQQNPMAPEGQGYHQSGTGNMALPWTRKLKEQQMSETENQYKDDFGGGTDFGVETLAFNPNYGGEDQYGDNAHLGKYSDFVWDEDALDSLDASLDDFMKQPNLGTESKLELIHRRRKLQVRPQDMETTSVKNDDMYLGNEPRGIGQSYPKSFDNFITDMPKWKI